MEHRQSVLSHRKLSRRQYAKKNTDYWGTGKKENCKKRKLDCVSNVVVQTEPEAVNTIVMQEKMNMQKAKRLKEMRNQEERTTKLANTKKHMDN